MGSKEGIDKLFFELASESRLGILRELQLKPLKMQEIARKLDLTDTESCKQLQRLTEAHLSWSTTRRLISNASEMTISLEN
jgi:predicted transcriptional regulator